MAVPNYFTKKCFSKFASFLRYATDSVSDKKYKFQIFLKKNLFSENKFRNVKFTMTKLLLLFVLVRFE